MCQELSVSGTNDINSNWQKREENQILSEYVSPT